MHLVLANDWTGFRQLHQLRVPRTMIGGFRSSPRGIFVLKVCQHDHVVTVLAIGEQLSRDRVRVFQKLLPLAVQGVNRMHLTWFGAVEIERDKQFASQPKSRYNDK